MSAAEYRTRRKPGGRKVAPKELRTYGGRVYHSANEARFAELLDGLRLAGVVKCWSPGVRVALEAHRCGQSLGRMRPLVDGGDAVELFADGGPAKIGDYIVDFLAETAHGEFWIEVKHPLRRARPTKPGTLGRIVVLDPEAEWKMRHFRAQYPERRLIVLSWVRREWVARYDTSLEDLAALAEAGLGFAGGAPAAKGAGPRV